MKKSLMGLVVGYFLVAQVQAETLYVDINSTNPNSPYNTWATAATTIQDAADMASSNDTVWVTNGVYAAGGAVVESASMTNRVLIPDYVTVQSVNGPEATFIRGSGIMGSDAVRCAYVGNHALLSGFTLTNGTTQTSGGYNSAQAGGGVMCKSFGVVSNCFLIKNTAQRYGGGAHGGKLVDCSLVENLVVYGGGGGAYSCVLIDCSLVGNSAGNGGGAEESRLNRCVLKENRASHNGGGAMVTYNGGLENCALIGNSAGNRGGGYCAGEAPAVASEGDIQPMGTPLVMGELNNCTLTGNSAHYGGGVAGGEYGGTVILKNCIVYFNRATESPNYTSTDFSYSCTTPLPSSGMGNIADNPQLASTSHLSTNSTCIGAGSTSYANETDIDAEIWRASPSMGCDELVIGSASSTLTVLAEANHTNVTIGYTILFTANISGQTTASTWIFGDGSVVSNQPYASHAFTTPGSHVIELVAYNDSNLAGVSSSVTVKVGDPDIHYVNLASVSPSAPYTSWATAATNIQEAIDAATQFGAHVLVTNGLYETGGQVIEGSLTNRIVIKEGLTVRSVNGPAATLIKGSGPLGDSAVRCAYLAEDALLSGFTLTNGHTRISGDLNTEQSGGSIWCAVSATASDCLIIGNAARRNGGGAYRGTLNHCTLSDNYAQYDGGGCSDGTLNYCSLLNNRADDDAGGANYCVLNYCLIKDNWAADNGGGTSSATLDNCLVTGNQAGDDGGGTESGTLRHCTVTGNHAGDGSSDDGGGTYSGTLINTVVYGNTAGGSYKNYQYGDFRYCCSTPLPSGTGNIADDPLFVNAASGDYHLQASSPAIDTANNGDMVLADDLDGTTRPVDGNNDGTATVDMGCYEFMVDADGDGIPDWWELLYFGGITNCDASGHADTDVYDNGQEYISGTDPTNETSFIGITNGVSMASGFVIQWNPSISNREYSVSWTMNDLTDTFTSLVTGIEFPQNSYTDTLHGVEESGFYKVDVKLK